MHCLIGCLAFLAPRLTIILVQLASGYIGQAYVTLLWPVLGWIFMPLTTLAYAWARNTYGTVEGFGVAVVVLAVLLDLGIIGKGRSSLRRGKQKGDD
jgi:hypothetical protein